MASLREPAAAPASIRLPLAIGTAVFALAYGCMAIAALRATGGTPVYPLDDTYIQMSLARTLAASGTYGFLPDAPAFSSSSPLFVLLLAASALVGLLDAAPALLNIAAAILALAAVLRFLASRGFSKGWLIAAALALNAIAPLAATAAVGLEHSLQIWMSVTVAALAARVGAGEARPRETRILFITAAVLVGCRFEGLFLIACVALMLVRRHPGTAVGIVAAGLLPVALHAVAAVSQGWSALPTSLIVKGHYPAAASAAAVIEAASARLERASQLWSPYTMFDIWPLLLVGITNVLGVAWGAWRGDRGSVELRLSLLFIGTTMLHAMFAKMDRLYGRYETYLIVLGLVACAPWVRAAVASLRPRQPNRAIAAASAGALIVLIVLGGLSVRRTLRFTVKVPVGSREMFLQQYQMGEFARRSLGGQTVAVNDLGLMAYRGRVRLFDLIGLGTIQIAREYRAGSLDPARIDALARANGVTVAMIYPGWITFLTGGVPDTWVPVADLRMPTSEVAGDPAVRIYVLDRDHEAALRADLQAFAPLLPEGADIRFLPSEPEQPGAVKQEPNR